MYKKLSCCKYCQTNFINLTVSERANHSRWCKENPKRDEYVKINNGSQLRTKDAIEKKIVGIKKAHADGKYLGSTQKSIETKKQNNTLQHTEETKQLLREKALASPHRRLKRKMIEYNGVWLDSTWELVLAKRLDELQIKWIRPEPIPWTDNNGLIHNYFPDFYLPEHNLYLDPKNPQAIKVQKKKIETLLQQYNNIVIIETLARCREFNV